MALYDIDVQLSGQDGNVFNLIGIVSKALKRAGESEAASTMTNEVFASESYDEALSIMAKYVNVS